MKKITFFEELLERGFAFLLAPAEARVFEKFRVGN
tara:strand:- start:87 stop:191 length:105 start_codon:yes stop_codon:yes gene_type:complete